VHLYAAQINHKCHKCAVAPQEIENKCVFKCALKTANDRAVSRRLGVNSLPKTVTRPRRDCDLNPGPSAPESSTLTTNVVWCGCGGCRCGVVCLDFGRTLALVGERERFLFTKANIRYQYHKTITSGRLPEGITHAGCL